MSEVTAQTLTETQINNSISGKLNKKKGVTRSVRNVISKPYSIFWPLADSQSESEVSALLDTLLPAARKVVSQDDRKCLRKMQGKRMKNARKALSQEIWKRNPGSKELRDCLAIGVNDVSRGLEDNELASILISNKADPPILTRHLATLAVTRNVPHLVLDNLKSSTKKSLDFAALTIGFKQVVSSNPEHHFHPIHEKIKAVCQTLVKNIGPSSDEDVTTLVEEKPPTAEPQKVYRAPHEIYLMRGSKNERAFVPGTAIKKESDSAAGPQYLSFTSSEKDGSFTPGIKTPQEVLGTSSSTETRSFLQTVRGTKKASQTFLQPMDTSPVLSLNVVKEEHPKDPTAVKKPTQRYFTSLAPLKVKRIQGNPSKNKKKKKKNG